MKAQREIKIYVELVCKLSLTIMIKSANPLAPYASPDFLKGTSYIQTTELYLSGEHEIGASQHEPLQLTSTT